VRISIRWKLILAIGLPLLLVYVVMLAVMIGELGDRAHVEMVERVNEATALYAAKSGSRLRAVARITEKSAATIASLPGLSEEQLTRLVRLHVESDRLIRVAELVLDDRRGAAPFSIRFDRTADGAVPEHPTERERTEGESAWPWLELVRRSGRPVWTEPYFEERGTGRVLFSFAAPVVRDGAVVGCLCVSLESLGLAAELAAIDIPGGGFSIITRKGNFLLLWEEARTGSVPNLFELAEEVDHPEYAEIGRRAVAGESGVVQTDGLFLPDRRWVAFSPVPSTDWSLIAVVPEDILLEFSREQLQLGLGFLLAGLVIILLLIWFMATRITRPVARLADAVEDLGTGDLDVRVTGIRTRDEIGELARGFNRMVGDLKAHIEALRTETAAREAVESELRVARKIQTALLPTDFPEDEAFELCAINLSAKQVAGDFFDFFRRDDGTLVFLIADVSGKGVPAAMYMAVARTVLRQVCYTQSSLGEAATVANEILVENDLGSMYVTAFIAWYDPASGSLRYVNAGHPPPYRVRSGGTVETLGQVTGTMLGLLPGRGYRESEEELVPEERLVLFTDGVPEAARDDEEFYGEERFEELLAGCADSDVRELCTRVAEAVETFQAGRLHDDVTVMAFERKTARGSPV
jgi:sigma-B regulation protein RsbU (phosphoserine phosphatase)